MTTSTAVPLQRIKADWSSDCAIVAATGPSLTTEVAHRCRLARFSGWRVVVVNDAYKRMPWADLLYACDARWWTLHEGAPELRYGERWSTHEDGPENTNSKAEIAERFKLNCVRGRAGDTFSTDPAVIHYGSNSGFQAVNLALLKGARRIVLVGFDMQLVGGVRHFFGDHPEPLHNRADYKDFIRPFRVAARTCPVPILNATPRSALDAFPAVNLEEELNR